MLCEKAKKSRLVRRKKGEGARNRPSQKEGKKGPGGTAKGDGCSRKRRPRGQKKRVAVSNTAKKERKERKTKTERR